jgi:hypothetical protein
LVDDLPSVQALRVSCLNVREIRGEDAQASAQGGGYHVDAVYDSVYFEDLAGRLYGLVIIFSDRLPIQAGQGVDVGRSRAAEGDAVAAVLLLPFYCCRRRGRQVRTAGFYDDAGFCPDCDAPYCYCYRHWHVSESGYGDRPRGHGTSLDPHW